LARSPQCATRASEAFGDIVKGGRGGLRHAWTTWSGLQAITSASSAMAAVMADESVEAADDRA